MVFLKIVFTVIKMRTQNLDQNPKLDLTSFKNPELETKIREMFKAKLSLKRRTLDMYAYSLARFCNTQNVAPFDFETVGLETIEDQTEQFIRTNQETLSPKYLNVIYNAVKSWCFCTKMIKSRKLFREIKFDKSSRKVDAISETSLETVHIKQMIQISDLDTKILIGLYGFCGLRPAIIPQLKIEDFAPNDYKIENGRIHFQNKNPFLYVPKEYEGNKAHIKFFVIVHSKISELLEIALNSNTEPVTAKTPLMRKYNSQDAIYQKVVLLFASVGFSGRPYLMRSYADKLLDRNLANGEKRDEDLKEFMLGHKGKISAIYQLKALSTEDAKVYRRMFENIDSWICENVFGSATPEGLTRAKVQAELAQQFGVNAEQLKQMIDALTQGKITQANFDSDLTKLIEAAQQRNLETKFETLFKKYVTERRAE
jgi:hypothetical protein